MRLLPAAILSARPVEWDEEGGEAEALVEDLLARPVVLQRGTPLVEETAAAAAVTSRPDRARVAEDERRLRALLAAFGGRVPGPIGEALERRRDRP